MWNWVWFRNSLSPLDFFLPRIQSSIRGYAIICKYWLKKFGWNMAQYNFFAILSRFCLCLRLFLPLSAPLTSCMFILFLSLSVAYAYNRQYCLSYMPVRCVFPFSVTCFIYLNNNHRKVCLFSSSVCMYVLSLINYRITLFSVASISARLILRCSCSFVVIFCLDLLLLLLVL